MYIFGSLLLLESMLEVGQKRMMGVWQAPARSKARVPNPRKQVGHRKESFQLPREGREGRKEASDKLGQTGAPFCVLIWSSVPIYYCRVLSSSTLGSVESNDKSGIEKRPH